MEDQQIVSLYWNKSETAISETQHKYGKYCTAIAYNILYSHEDAAEVVNDTYMAAWNSIPPHRPAFLAAFLGKITRRISIDRWKKSRAEKRGGGEMPLALDELEECIPSPSLVEHEIEEKQLAFVLNEFLRKLPEPEQQVFMCRYWYLDSISSICTQFNFSQSKVKSMLARTRKKLRTQLEKEGICNET